MMKKFFSVAECVFAVEFEEKHPFGEHLGNYFPFECEAGETIFTLGFDDNLRRPEGLKPLIVGAAEPQEPKVDLYECENGWWLEFAPLANWPSVAGLIVPSDGSKAFLNVYDRRYERFAIDNALMILYAFKTCDKGVLEMHSSVVEYKGKGYMFLGVSGTGKSTHSRMWLETFPEASLLNDDNPAIRLIDGRAFVFGTPWSGKTPCYKARRVPVGAIVRIRRAPFNKVTELQMPEAYAEIYSSSSGFKADEAMADALHETIADVVSSVGCYVLDCLPDRDAAIVCNKNVIK